MIEAINAGRIPRAFQEHLQARANELVNTVNCPAPTTTQGETTEERKPKKEKTKKKDEEVTIPTGPLPPITEDDQ